MTPVFLTIDTELMWRHHAAALDARTIYARSIEPAGVGIGYQLGKLAEHGLKATFFVDPMPARIYGLEPFKQLVGAILDSGQEVQLHLHPNWTGASVKNRRAAASFELIGHDRAAQQALLAEARDWLEQAGAPRPIAFRAGSYSANDDTVDALVALGFAYDSSHNGSEHPWPSAIGLPRDQIAPVAHRGLIELPVTLIEDRAGNLRHFQICALSAAEMRAALGHAEGERHAAVVIVSHGFELANRAGTRVNRVHRSRFDSLCALLAERRDMLPTQHFGDRPVLALGRQDRPLGPSTLRTRLRQAEQLWSNWVEERAA